VAGRVVVHVDGDLSGENARRVHRTLAGELGDRPEVVILDLTTIGRIDDDGIDTLRSIAELAAVDDIGLYLVAPVNGTVQVRLAAAGSTDMFEMIASVAEAVRRMS
jgi:anti-anti-sigma regulatory factor